MNFRDPSIQIIPVMENQMEHDMETAAINGICKGLSIQILPKSGHQVCKHYLHWAIVIPRKCPEKCSAHEFEEASCGDDPIQGSGFRV